MQSYFSEFETAARSGGPAPLPGQPGFGFANPHEAHACRREQRTIGYPGFDPARELVQTDSVGPDAPCEFQVFPALILGIPLSLGIWIAIAALAIAISS